MIFRFFRLLTVMLCLPACALADPAATLAMVDGTVHLVRSDGKRLLLAAGSTLAPGDVITTERSSYAKLRFSDGAEVALRPSSRLAIDDYRFDEARPADDAALVRLLKGGLRTVTGLIGKRGNQDAYRLQGGTATIGIRGTDFVARLCAKEHCEEQDEEIADDDAPAKPAQKSPATTAGDALPHGPGLYTEVKSGSVIVRQDGRTLILRKGETGFAARNGLDLYRLNTQPNFLQQDAWMRSMRIDPAACRTR